MRWVFAEDLFDPGRIKHKDDARDDFYIWPWGHLLILRGALESLGTVLLPEHAMVVCQIVSGILAIFAIGRLVRTLGGDDVACTTASVLFVTMPWTTRLALSLLSDLPATAALLWGCAWHLEALRLLDNRRRAWKHLLLGDLAFAIAMTFRYEAWIAGAMAGLASTALLARTVGPRHSLRAGLARAPIYFAFPAAWLAIQAARFHGDALFFRTMAAARTLLHPSLANEIRFELANLVLAAPVVWLALLASVILGHRKPALGSSLRLHAYPALVAVACQLTVLYSAMTMGRGSNIPERFVHVTLSLLLPSLGIIVSRAIPRTREALRLVLVIACTLVIPSLMDLTGRAPFRQGMPVDLSRRLAAIARERHYDRSDEFALLNNWNAYHGTFEPLCRLHDMKIIRHSYITRHQGAFSLVDVTPRTRLVMTTNLHVLELLRQRGFRHVMTSETGGWWAVDLDARTPATPR